MNLNSILKGSKKPKA